MTINIIKDKLIGHINAVAESGADDLGIMGGNIVYSCSGTEEITSLFDDDDVLKEGVELNDLRDLVVEEVSGWEGDDNDLSWQVGYIQGVEFATRTIRQYVERLQ